MSYNKIENATFNQQFKTLKELNLRQNKITGIKFGCEIMPGLQKLYLSNNCLTSLDFMQGLPNKFFSSLTELTIENNPITLGDYTDLISSKTMMTNE